MKICWCMYIFILILNTACVALCQESNIVVRESDEMPVPSHNQVANTVPSIDDVPTIETDEFDLKTTFQEKFLSILVLLFGCVVLLLQFILLKQSPNSITQDSILLIYAVTLILVGTLFLITAGITSKHIAPAMGLYGTIVGYLLGKRSSSRNGQSEINKKNNRSRGPNE